MQRQSLVPLYSFMQGRGRQGAGTKMLEVACGTGRFATFVKVWHLFLFSSCFNLSVSLSVHVAVSVLHVCLI